MYNRIPWYDSQVTNGFWSRRQELIEKVTIPSLYKTFKQSGRMDCMKGMYKPNPDGKDALRDRANGKEEGILNVDGTISLFSLSELQGEPVSTDSSRAPRPHHYWDSDVAKWIEGASYSLKYNRNDKIENIIDDIVDAYANIQEEDGYLNTYFTFVEPGKRLTNIEEMHEMYCAGHLLEAAIVYYEATGKKKFLDIITKYIDFLISVIGPEKGQLHAYPGHQEIELALMRLYALNHEEKYLNFARYLIYERGKKPYYFDIEAKREGRNPNKPTGKGFNVRDGYVEGPYAEFQSHCEIKNQKEAVGHAVRFMYMCCGITDVAAAENDKVLIDTVKGLWQNVTQKKMYVTGGIGSDAHGERFAFAYHLPNEDSYNETCAAAGFIMWAARMSQLELNSEYGDILERVLYNGFSSGLSLEGNSYFYANHLQCCPQKYINRVERQSRMFPVRQSNFPVSCCPTNIVRVSEAITGYAITCKDDALFFHTYIGSDTTTVLNGEKVLIKETTQYPYDEKIQFSLQMEKTLEFSLGFRIPGWCTEWSIKVNGNVTIPDKFEKGYAIIKRSWNPEDIVTLVLQMKPFLIEANPSVRMDCGKVCIQCGPFVYCLEEIDNGKNLEDIVLKKDTVFKKYYDKDLLGGTTVITADATRRDEKTWDDILYRHVQDNEYVPCKIKAIPYYLWANRGLGEMTVWINYNRGIESWE